MRCLGQVSILNEMKCKEIRIFVVTNGTPDLNAIVINDRPMGIIFQCFLYEEALVKTSLVTLSDRRQARLMDKLFKKILENRRRLQA